MKLGDWLEYRWLLLQSALGLLPPPPKERHGHQCPDCGVVWYHEPRERRGEFPAMRVSDEELSKRDHTCPRPGCGAVQWWPMP